MAKKIIVETPVTFNLTRLGQAHASLKLFESKYQPIKVGKLNLSTYLIAHAGFPDDSHDPKDIRTKRRILFTAGIFNRNPASLTGLEDLKSDYEYGLDEYAILRSRLDVLVKEYKRTSSISLPEMKKCTIVNQCVSLVLNKT